MTRAYLAQRLHGIYAIVNEGPGDAVELTRAILDGGARIVQYRAKSGIVPSHAQAMRELTRAAGALFILNDTWRAVAAYDADGVHVGPDDVGPGDITEIRKALPEQLIGLSCGTAAEGRAAEGSDVDYIGVGSIFATPSKADAGEPIGIAGLRAVTGHCRLPVAAIGGIGHESIREVALTGVAMAAVISAIAQSGDPRGAVAELVQLWNDNA
ncbi:MAG TPA: thiamine phosphate synthase [Candidatus Baltobacteraceae bacterium]